MNNFNLYNETEEVKTLDDLVREFLIKKKTISKLPFFYENNEDNRDETADQQLILPNLSK